MRPEAPLGLDAIDDPRAGRAPVEGGPAPGERLGILHVLNHTHRLNGNVHAAVDLACAQARLGHRVTLCSGGGDFDALLAANGVAVARVSQARRPAALLRALPALARLCRERRIDVVHAHMMTSALLAWPVCRVRGIPLVTTVHNEFQKSAIVMALGHRVIAVSAAVGRSMGRRGIPASRLRVVLNGTIGAARFADARGRRESLGAPAILFVGGLHPRKGVADLLDAFETVHAAHPSARLCLVGEGPYLDAYRARAATMACAEAVRFVGAVADPRPYLDGADIFVLPSRADPAPLVLSEAREAGCAVVASDVDGVPELLEGGSAGLLVPPRDPRRLADAILSLVEDPANLRRWRTNSQVNIEHLTIARVARDTVAVYAECLAPASHGTRTTLAPQGIRP